MPQPVVLHVVFVPAEGSYDAVSGALSTAIAEVHAEPGCELYALHAGPDNTLVLLEKWSSEEELAAHSTGDPVARLNASLEGLLVEPANLTKLTPVAAGTATQGEL